MSRFSKVCFSAGAMAFAANMVCMVPAYVVWGPDALVTVFKYGTWIFFPFALPICAKYLK